MPTAFGDVERDRAIRSLPLLRAKQPSVHGIHHAADDHVGGWLPFLRRHLPGRGDDIAERRASLVDDTQDRQENHAPGVEGRG